MALYHMPRVEAVRIGIGGGEEAQCEHATIGDECCARGERLARCKRVAGCTRRQEKKDQDRGVGDGDFFFNSALFCSYYKTRIRLQ
jgi:hypothetical protein